jgi:hypothetical protein
MTSNGRLLVDWKGNGRKLLWPNLKYYYGICPDGLRTKTKNNSVAWVIERTIPIERPPLVGEVNASTLGYLDRGRYFSFQVAPQLYLRGWVGPVPDPLFLRKSGSRESNPDLLMCSQDLWPLDQLQKKKPQDSRCHGRDSIRMSYKYNCRAVVFSLGYAKPYLGGRGKRKHLMG